MDKVNSILKYISFRRKAVSKYKIHSPFVYDFIINVLEDKKEYPEYSILDALRDGYYQNRMPVEVIDFGAVAGRNKYESYYRNVSDIAKKSGQRRKYTHLLFRILRYFQPDRILELGTSLGLSTSSFSLARPQAVIDTIEGCSGVASLAKENFEKNNFNNIQIHIGSFEKILPDLLKGLGTLDFVYFDGNHRKSATLDYFQQCLQKVNNDTIFVFDDIYWSKGMTGAWEEIKSHQQVSVSIDLFQLGIVFFRKESAKQDFILKY